MSEEDVNFAFDQIGMTPVAQPTLIETTLTDSKNALSETIGQIGVDPQQAQKILTDLDSKIKTEKIKRTVGSMEENYLRLKESGFQKEAEEFKSISFNQLFVGPSLLQAEEILPSVKEELSGGDFFEMLDPEVFDKINESGRQISGAIDDVQGIPQDIKDIKTQVVGQAVPSAKLAANSIDQMFKEVNIRDRFASINAELEALDRQFNQIPKANRHHYQGEYDAHRQRIMGEFPEAVTETRKNFADRSAELKKVMAKFAIPDDSGVIKTYLADVAGGIRDLIPTVALGATGVGAIPAITPLLAKSMGSNYDDLTQNLKVEPGEAANAATMFATGEALLSILPLKVLTGKGGGGIIRKAIAGGSSEFSEEAITSLVQETAKLKMFDPRYKGLSMKEFFSILPMNEKLKLLKNAGYDGLVGFGAGSSLATTMSAIESKAGPETESPVSGLAEVETEDVLSEKEGREPGPLTQEEIKEGIIREREGQPIPEDLEGPSGLEVEESPAEPKRKMFDSLSEAEQAEADTLIKEIVSNTQLNTGIDPRQFKNMAALGKLIVKDGAIKFSEFSQRIINVMGESVRPFIKDIYKSITGDVDEATPAKEVDAFDLQTIPIEPTTGFLGRNDVTTDDLVKAQEQKEGIDRSLVPPDRESTVQGLPDSVLETADVDLSPKTTPEIVESTVVGEPDGLTPETAIDVTKSPKGAQEAFGARFVKSEKFSQEVRDRARIASNDFRREVIPMAATQKEIEAKIKKNGSAWAFEQFANPDVSMEPRVRVGLGLSLESSLETLIEKETDPAKRDDLINRQVNLTRALSSLGTDYGRGGQMFAAFSKMHWRSMVRSYEDAVMKKQSTIKDKIKKDIDKVNKLKTRKPRKDKGVKRKPSKLFSSLSKAKQTRAQELIAQITSGSQLNTGIDPSQFKALIELGALVVQDGAVKFADFSKNMIEAVGESIKPVLGQVFEEVNKTIKPTQEAITEAEKVFKRRLRRSKATPREKKTTIDKIMEEYKRGTLDTEKYYEMVQEPLKLPKFDPEVAKEIKKFSDKIKKAPEGFQKEEATIDMLNFLESHDGLDKTQLVISMAYSNILSGLGTQEVNAFGSGVLTAMETGLLTAKNPKDALFIIKGLSDLIKVGAPKAQRILKTGKITGARLEKLTPNNSLEQIDSKALRGLFEAIKTKSTAPLKGVTAKDALKQGLKTWASVFRVMSAVDTLFFEAGRGAQSRATAVQIARKEGFKGKDATRRAMEILHQTDKDMQDAKVQADEEGLSGIVRRIRINEIMEQSRPEELNDKAREFGLKSTFNGEPTGLMGSVSRAINKVNQETLLTIPIVPFTRILGNVFNTVIDYSPAGYLNLFAEIAADGEPIRGGSLFKGDKAKAFDDAARATAGMVAMSAVYAMAFNDNEEDNIIDISGSGPKSINQLEQLRQTGYRTESIKIGGKWYSYRDTPLALALGVLGNYKDSIRYKDMTKEEADAKLGAVLKGVGKSMLNINFLKSLSDFLENVENPGENPFRGMARTASAFATPNIAKEIGSYFNDDKYNAESILGAFLQQIPSAVIQDKAGNTRRFNVLGEFEKKDTRASKRFVTPENLDPMWNMIVDKGAFVSRVATSTTITDKEGVRDISPKEYAELSFIRGRSIKDRIMENLSNFQKDDPERVKKEINKISEEAKNLTKAFIEIKLATPGVSDRDITNTMFLMSLGLNVGPGALGAKDLKSKIDELQSVSGKGFTKDFQTQRQIKIINEINSIAGKMQKGGGSYTPSQLVKILSRRKALDSILKHSKELDQLRP